MNWFPPELVNAARDTWAWAGLHPVIFWGLVAAMAVNNGLRLGAYRDYVSRPPWARFIVAATDPFCGNFWRLLSWISAKFSLPFKFPNGDDPQTITAQAVRNAVAADDAAKEAQK